jgi:hypothetical protein
MHGLDARGHTGSGDSLGFRLLFLLLLLGLVAGRRVVVQPSAIVHSQIQSQPPNLTPRSRCYSSRVVWGCESWHSELLVRCSLCHTSFHSLMPAVFSKSTGHGVWCLCSISSMQLGTLTPLCIPIESVTF